MFFSDYSVHDLPSDESCMDDSVSAPCTETEAIVNNALVARIEALEAEAHRLRSKHNTKSVHFRLENITHSVYTGFHSYEILVAFFEFLGPCEQTTVLG